MVDYSKWKNIEISDDEDDTHPNIDTASLFRWRHQARVERMAEHEREKQQIEEQKALALKKKEELAQKIKDGKEMDDKLKELELETKELEEKENEIKKKEKSQPWNVDTISKESWSKTIINKPAKKLDRSQLSDEELEKMYKEFVAKNEDKVKHFALLRKYDDCKSYLLANPELICEETANYLALWCLNLEIEEKHELMDFVSKQVVSMQYILELAKQLDVDPRGCVSAFFARIQKADKEYNEAFEDELKSFKERIRQRAKKRIEQAMKEVEEEERQKRIGPGGLDPQEVFESLPECLQKCFESRDVGLLQKTITEMDEKDARYHMKRCVDSGLWVPDAKSAQLLHSQEEDEEPKDEDEIYAEPKDKDKEV
jgi:cell division cycle protein 37